MRALVTNWGPTAGFPTHLGDIFLAHMDTQELTDRKAVDELSKFQFISIKIIDPPALLIEKKVDWSIFKINDLRKIAKRYGTLNTFSMRKADLIKHMEEKYHG